jgi:hypothetical protein
MASAKSLRSRPSGHSGVFPVNAVAGDGGEHADKLKIFKTDNFDPDSYVQSSPRLVVKTSFLPCSKSRGIRGLVFHYVSGAGKCEIGRDYDCVVEEFDE